MASSRGLHEPYPEDDVAVGDKVDPAGLFEDAQRLTAIFGRWPSFHDSEVLRLVLDRSGPEGPTLEAIIHVFQATNELDARGYYVLKYHTEASLRFTRVEELDVQWFNAQNVISELVVEPLDPAEHEGRKLRVKMPPIYGVGVELECERAIVTSTRPFEKAD